MTARKNVAVVKRLRSVMSGPSKESLAHSRKHLSNWFNEQAPLIQWGEMTCPLGKLFVAVNRQGLFALDFGRPENEFLARLDARARLEKNSEAVQAVLAQLRNYFAGKQFDFDLAVDLSLLTPFQRSVLELARQIAPGEVWTYHRVAEELGRPHSSRPVGQALACNPVPIVIPCHRVIASNGGLHGYSGGSGLKAKQWLLELEGAL